MKTLRVQPKTLADHLAKKLGERLGCSVGVVRIYLYVPQLKREVLKNYEIHFANEGPDGIYLSFVLQVRSAYYVKTILAGITDLIDKGFLQAGDINKLAKEAQRRHEREV